MKKMICFDFNGVLEGTHRINEEELYHIVRDLAATYDTMVLSRAPKEYIVPVLQEHAIAIPIHTVSSSQQKASLLAQLQEQTAVVFIADTQEDLRPVAQLNIPTIAVTWGLETIVAPITYATATVSTPRELQAAIHAILNE